MIALSGLVVDDVLVYDHIEMDPGTLFERAIPLEERERMVDEVLAWTATPTNHFHPDGAGWFSPVETWTVSIEQYSSRRLVEDRELEDRIRRTAATWQHNYIADIGDGLVCGRPYYVVRSAGGSLHNCIVAEVYGTLAEVRGCVIGALRADVSRLEGSVIRRLGTWRVETIHSSCVGMATMPSIGMVDASIISAHGGTIRQIRRSIAQGAITTFEPPTEDCIILGRREVI